MEQRFFDSISDEQQDKVAEAIQMLKSDALARSTSTNGKTREDVKGSYSRRLAGRLRVKA